MLRKSRHIGRERVEESDVEEERSEVERGWKFKWTSQVLRLPVGLLGKWGGLAARKVATADCAGRQEAALSTTPSEDLQTVLYTFI